jgi:4-hydroxy-tetrahydrodipicolinate synthase
VSPIIHMNPTKNESLLFRGVCTSVITPFTSDGLVDDQSFRRLIANQVSAGVDSLVILGTTGEESTVSRSERRHLVETAIDNVAGRVPIIVGTGTQSTSVTVELSREAADTGASMLMLVTPYYNQPTVEGLQAHLEAVAAAVDLPLMLYHVPRRTGFALSADAFLELARKIPTLQAIKDASGNLSLIVDIIAGRSDNMGVYSGDEEFALPLLLLGGDGLISVLSNIAPRATIELIHSALCGDWVTARAAHFRLLKAMRACFIVTNPIPIKAALAQAGLTGPALRLPLQVFAEPTRSIWLPSLNAVVEKP